MKYTLYSMCDGSGGGHGVVVLRLFHSADNVHMWCYASIVV